MKALVTGASGFTGSHLVKRLVRDGYKVTALVRKKSNLSRLKNVKCEFVYGDVRDKEEIEEAVKGKDIVFHLAAAWQNYSMTTKEFHDINVTGTKNLLDAARKYGVKRFIHTSTVGVLGNVKEIPASERTEYNPGYPYQHTKLEAELLALAYYRKYKLPVTVVRPSGVHGPGDKRFLKVFKLIKEGKLVMIGKGDKWYHLTYIDDLIQGYVLCATKKKAIGQVYIFANEEPVTIQEFAHLVAKIVKGRPPRMNVPVLPVYLVAAILEAICTPLRIKPFISPRRLDPFRNNRIFSISKAKKELGFKPKVGLEEGLKRTAAWYKKEGWL